MKASLFVALLSVLLVTFLGSTSVEGTWGWFAGPQLPTLRRPTKCGTGIIVGTVTKESLPDNSSIGTVSKRSPPDNYTTVDFPSFDTTPTPLPLAPVESRTLETTSDFGIPLGSSLPSHPGAWLVRIGNTSAAGVLVSNRHVLTLAQCLTPFLRWIGGFYDFGVQLLGDVVPVLKIQVQTAQNSLTYPLALLTLADHNLTDATSVCVGDYNQGLTYSAVTWELSEGIPMKYPVLVYPHSTCNSAAGEYERNVMLCASPGSPEPMVCGSPLLQEDNGRYLLIGLSSGYLNDFATYVQLSQGREWLGL